jgi:hypothetical protein
MLLPKGDRAVVDVSKLRDYCLDPAHPFGRHKARVFAARLGILRKHALWFRVALLNAATGAQATPGVVDGFGARYVVDFAMSGPKGSGTIRSAWIIRNGEDFPRFLTAYVL